MPPRQQKPDLKSQLAAQKDRPGDNEEVSTLFLQIKGRKEMKK